MDSDKALTLFGRLASVSDGEILSVMKRLSAAERTLSVYALVHLSEIQRRKLHEGAGYTSLFTYCVKELRYSEANAYRRLQAADAARKFPEVLYSIREGELTVCALSVIAKHLTRENYIEVLKKIERKSVRDVERLAVEFSPRPDTRDVIRAAPNPPSSSARVPSSPALDAPADSVTPAPVEISKTTVEPSTIPAVPVVPFHAPCVSEMQVAVRPPERITPRSPSRHYFGFTGSEELRLVIERLRDVLWHKYPDGRLEDILLEAGKDYLRRRDPELLPISEPKRPRDAESRVVVRWVRSLVYRRDGGRCAFIGQDGRRCEARRGLEYDHIRPWSKGGRSDDPMNIRLLCRTHNQWSARAEGLT